MGAYGFKRLSTHFCRMPVLLLSESFEANLFSSAPLGVQEWGRPRHTHDMIRSDMMRQGTMLHMSLHRPLCMPVSKMLCIYVIER